jgi:predicted nucleotidyltransferase
MTEFEEIIPGIPNSYAQKILHLFNSLEPGSKVVLFGSRAKGNFREGSDIDLALKGPKLSVEIRERFLLKYLDLEMPWKLDLVIYDFITEPELKRHIDRVGIDLFSG